MICPETLLFGTGVAAAAATATATAVVVIVVFVAPQSQSELASAVLNSHEIHRLNLRYLNPPFSSAPPRAQFHSSLVFRTFAAPFRFVHRFACTTPHHFSVHDFVPGSHFFLCAVRPALCFAARLACPLILTRWCLHCRRNTNAFQKLVLFKQNRSHS